LVAADLVVLAVREVLVEWGALQICRHFWENLVFQAALVVMELLEPEGEEGVVVVALVVMVQMMEMLPLQLLLGEAREQEGEEVRLQELVP
jgi:hypothetical protein